MEYNGKHYEIKIWQGELLNSVIAIDTETTYGSFTETPDLVTFQAFDGVSPIYVRNTDVLDFLKLHKKHTWLFANASFDLDVLEKAVGWNFYEQIDNNGVYDVLIMYCLYHLATMGSVPFQYSLAKITHQFFGIELSKDNEIRTRFDQFQNQKIEEIPKEFLEYGAKDVIATYEAFIKLNKLINELGSASCLSHQIQLAGSIALNRVYKNGIGFDHESSKEYLNNIYKEMEICQDILATYGWARGVKGAKDLFNQVIVNEELTNLPLTSEGDFSSKEEDLKHYKNNRFIKTYLKYIGLEKSTTFIRELTGNRVHPRYNVIRNTGRTSCSKPNFQQLPREGGIRNLFKAKKGHTFIITDYSSIELSTLAQTVYDRYGSSIMREKINSGADLHKYYASVLFNVSEESVVKWQRQAAKAANFGFPGGLGIETFIKFAKGYDIELTYDEASNMKKTWFNAFPEMKEYLQGEVGHVWTRSGRLRANTTFCAEKNTPFQGMAADGAKVALWNLTKAGFTIVGFVHDEIICEVPLNEVEFKKKQMEKIMIDSMQIVVPDVKIAVESTISERYCK
ncbi:MAG: hypothetical protein CMG00_06030 [Candidatus Marinimicrobia bacterium]|nr:hypothetical protein [Candidatus Neomarinimicrobiota bacterium]|tara:strand:+ start:8042 stop:9742 length:1701 start_codon:yes stop_codon:yes gene_type:complete